MDINIVRSKRKTLSLEVKSDCTVVLRAPFWCSKKTIDTFIDEKSSWLEKTLKHQRDAQKNSKKLTDEEIIKLKKRAKELLPERVEYYASLMNVKPAGVKITSAKKRFGSCSSKNSICFSYILMLYPPDAIDYVVVHELAHIVHHNHGLEFYKLIESVLPDYKRREAMLKVLF